MATFVGWAGALGAVVWCGVDAGCVMAGAAEEGFALAAGAVGAPADGAAAVGVRLGVGAFMGVRRLPLGLADGVGATEPCAGPAAGPAGVGVLAPAGWETNRLATTPVASTARTVVPAVTASTRRTPLSRRRRATFVTMSQGVPRSVVNRKHPSGLTDLRRRLPDAALDRAAERVQMS